LSRTETDPGLLLLLDRGAGELAHPGGTLGAHLRRVGDRLAAHGVDEDVRRAGLCHAAYGTDGFPHPLLSLDERPVLRALVGVRAEAIVLHYAACDRVRTYTALAGDPVVFVNRFTGTATPTPRTSLREFAALTVANELDVLDHGALTRADCEELRALVADLDDLLTPAARVDALRSLATTT
jgi:hypothetical protein